MAKEASNAPRMAISRRAAGKLRAFIDECRGEISGFGTVEVTGNGFLIQDIFILEQEVSWAGTAISEEDMARFVQRLLDEGKDPATVRVWWHSHADMENFWSRTDKDTIASCFLSDFMITMVGNKKGRLKVRLNIYKPSPVVIDYPPVELGASVDPELRAEAQAEIGKKVRVIPLPEVEDMPCWLYADLV